jgi:3-oxoadipate enol-lactonase
VEQVTADDGVALAAAVEGPADAPVLLMLHSIGCDHAMWEPQRDALRDWRTIRLDLRGHGGSAAPDGDCSLERLARDALAVLDASGVDAAVVCGLSLGGLVAQQLAILAPERVRGLVLANTAARIGTAEAWRDRAMQVREQGLAAIADMAMGRFFSEGFRTQSPKVVEAFRARLLASSPAGYAGCCAALRDADLRPELPRIAAPTLVVAGALDVSTPPEQMRALAAGLANSRYVELDAAHLSNVERPAAFAAALLEHLESL